ncbi:MAG TPA: hypothetical protein VH763_19700 [Gemmatimonadales bacterium]
MPSWTPRPITAPRPEHQDTVSTADPPAPPDSAVPVVMRRRFVLSPQDSARWPVKAPEPLAGSLLPEHRIVAYYGNPRSSRMGILGQLPREEMLQRLEETAREWAKADTGRAVMPALHLIAVVAQGSPGPGRKYRFRMSDSLVEEVASWVERRGWIIFLDIQAGHSSIAQELPELLGFLQRPYVHLALDPEFALGPGGVPGRRIGTLDASDVNLAIRTLADLVSRYHLPPKVLVVHRFNRRMLTRSSLIQLDPRVQVVVNMDGFGAPYHKLAAYRTYIVPYPVQYTGLKLFYKNDRVFRGRGRPPDCSAEVDLVVGCGRDGLMTPGQVLGIYPQPLYIQYQ